MGNPLISIIIPVYNMGEKLENSVQSIIDQTYKNLEIILVDDGSRDNSYCVCQKLEKLDPRIRSFHTENQGSGPARNRGIREARGEYLYFPDADDYVEPDAIEIFTRSAEENNADIVLCGYRCANEAGEILTEKKMKSDVLSGKQVRDQYAFYKIWSKEHGFGGAPWNKFFKKAVVREYDITYPPLRRHQDEGFIARFFDHCEKAVFIEDILYTYYSNTQKAEWKKYPVDYIDAVCGLYEERKSNVLRWNPGDLLTKKTVDNELICNTIKACELTFSPKFNFDKAARLKWIREHLQDSEIRKMERNDLLGNYQSVILSMIKKERYRMLYHVLHFKVTVTGKNS